MQGDRMRNTLCIPIEGNEEDGGYEAKLTVLKGTQRGKKTKKISEAIQLLTKRNGQSRTIRVIVVP